VYIEFDGIVSYGHHSVDDRRHGAQVDGGEIPTTRLASLNEFDFFNT
jgi:hypothetical protein